jgi:outer membrane receptor protein involved in Fe transport
LRVRLPTIGLFLCGLATVAWPQASGTTGQIEGVISDATGAVLPGVAVRARSADTGFERSTKTDDTGLYRLVLLPLGRYELTAEREGFAPVQHSSLTLMVGQTLNVPLHLELAAVEAAVEVRADAPSVDTTRSLSTTMLDARAIATLPIDGRRFQTLALCTPGAAYRANGRVGIGGQRGVHTAYVIDGASYDSPFFGGMRGGENVSVAYTISQEAIQEFQVTNAGYSAEFGRSAGGVVKAVTRSGTNDLHGSAFWYFQDESLMAHDAFGRPPLEYVQNQLGATLGGPLKKDKLHFFVAYDQQIRRDPVAVEFLGDPTGIPGFEGKEETFDGTEDVWTALARIDYQLDGSNRLSVRYNWSRNVSQTPSFRFVSGATSAAAENGTFERMTTNTVVAQLATVASATSLNELRLQYSRESTVREPGTTSPTVEVAGLGTVGGAFYLPALVTDERFQLVDNFTWLRGAHSVRFGVDINLTHSRQPFFLLFSGGYYAFGSVDDYLTTLETGEQRYAIYLQGFGRADTDLWQQEYAFYAQDTWRVGRSLTLNYGLRYEAQINPQPDEPNPELEGSDRIASDTNNFGPRVGVSWDPWGDNKGVVRLNAGLFFARTPAIELVSAFRGNGTAQQQLAFSSGLPGAPTFPDVLETPPPAAFAPPSDVTVFEQDFQNPRTFQVSLGIEREVLPDLVLGASYVHARMRQLTRLLDINLSPASGRAPDGRLFYGDPRPDPRFNRILQKEASARGTYNGLTLSLRKRWRPSDRWFNRGLAFQAYYTLSKTLDDNSDELSFNYVSYQDWQDLAKEYTVSNNDLRHLFLASGTWELAAELRVGVTFVSVPQGFPYSRVTTIDLNGDGSSPNDRQFIDGQETGRNAFRQPAFSLLNLRIAKGIRLGDRARLEIAADVFNVLGADNLVVTDNRNFLNNPDVGVPDHAGAPRTLQLSARLQF